MVSISRALVVSAVFVVVAAADGQGFKYGLATEAEVRQCQQNIQGKWPVLDNYCKDDCAIFKTVDLHDRCLGGFATLEECVATAFDPLRCSGRSSDPSPPHMSEEALTECLENITAEVPGSVSYCQDKCKTNVVALSIPRCETAGKTNLLDCTAYLEPICGQSKPGAAGGSPGGNSSGGGNATPDELGVCVNQLVPIAGSPLPASYCADRCSQSATDSTIRDACSKYGYSALIDCVDFIEAQCEKSSAGNGGSGNGNEGGSGNGNADGLKDVEGCRNAIVSTCSRSDMMSWCKRRCDFFSTKTQFLEGCKAYNKLTLAECVDYVETYCEVSGASSSASRILDIAPPAETGSQAAECQSLMQGETPADDAYCQEACAKYAAAPLPEVCRNIEDKFAACVDFLEPRCVRKQVYQERTECLAEIVAENGNPEITAYCQDQCREFAHIVGYRKSCVDANLTNLLECVDFASPVCVSRKNH
eukprot:Gregarina_sp_Poly_1__314@NODE_1077_length_5170_cov_692_612581_g748_i0_p3_GENE_NODE_1077_length_5170_cov_692_612581_g748_i0NODE_1077_length_5170_cov_692_612581_g748_i0_p3_ORF_typecomplete_len476_score58_24_NODE_1077_length_5170_cov_692_612581_g748_i02421669